MHKKLLYEGLMDLFSSKEDGDLNIKSKVSAIHQHLKVEKIENNLSSILSLKIKTNNLSELPSGFKERLKNTFGVYTKHSYEEIKDLFIRLYKYRYIQVTEWLEDPEAMIRIIRFYSQRLSMSPKDIIKAKKEIKEKLLNLDLIIFIADVSKKFAQHCEEPERIDAFMITLYKFHYVKMMVARNKIIKILGTDID